MTVDVFFKIAQGKQKRPSFQIHTATYFPHHAHTFKSLPYNLWWKFESLAGCNKAKFFSDILPYLAQRFFLLFD